MSEATETDQIERDLARTRARMDSRLDELQERLSPGQIVNDAFAYFRGGGGADFTHDLLDKLRANPLPALVTGIGIAWLMAWSDRAAYPQAGASHDPDLPMRLRTAEAEVVQRHDEHPEAYAGRVDEARGKVLGVVRNPSDTGASYGKRIKDAMAAAGQSVRETAHDFTASTSAVGSRLSVQAQRRGVAAQQGMATMTRSTRETFASATGSPIALGAIAAVVGLIAGSLIPTSEEEERALGAAAGKLRTAGRDLAQDAVDRGARVASDALGAVKESAEAHGLSGDRPIGEIAADLKSGALVGAVKDVAGEAVSAGRDSVQTHFASGGNGDGDDRQGSDDSEVRR